MAKKQNPLRRLRNKLNLNQQQFWSRVGVTQSCGSRYETGRALPAPVNMLLTIAYGTSKQAARTLHKLGVSRA